MQTGRIRQIKKYSHCLRTGACVTRRSDSNAGRERIGSLDLIPLRPAFLFYPYAKEVCKLGTTERRNAILRTLCRRRYETIGNLAAEFEVSERTIRRDIEILSYTEPIYTQSGRHAGGVYVVDGYHMDRMYMSEDEIAVLQKLKAAATVQNPGFLLPGEEKMLESIIRSYAKPKNQ